MTNPEDGEVLHAKAQPEPGTGLPAATPAPAGTANAAPAAAKITPGDLVLGGPALASDIIGTWLQQ